MGSQPKQQTGTGKVRSENNGASAEVSLSLSHTNGESKAACFEDDLRTLANNLPAILWTTDTQFRFTSISGGLLKILGLDLQHLLGLTLAEYFCNHDPAFSPLAAHAKALQGETFNYKLEWLGRNFDATVEPMHDSQGRMVGVLGAALDTSEPALVSSSPTHESAFRELLENANDLIYTQDLEANFTWVNQTALRVTGYTFEEAIHMNMRDIVAPEFQEISNDVRQQRLQGAATSLPYEIEILTKDRRRIPLEVSTRFIYKEGKPIGTQGSARDISKRKRAEQASQIQKIYLEELFENSPEAVTILDSDFKAQRVNREFMRMFGYSAEEVHGKLLADFILPAGQEYEAQSMRERALKGEKISIETKRRRKDGSLMDVFLLSTPIVAQGRQIGIYAIYRDVTERRQSEQALRISEERYRLLFERNLAGVYWATLDGQFIDCNESFARMFGYESRAEVMARSADDFYNSSGERQLFLAELKERRTITNLETCPRRKDGSPIWVLENISLVDDMGSEPLIQGTMIDITERKYAEEGLKQAEGKYRSIFENAAEGIFQTSLDGRWLIVNPKLAQVLGYDSAADLTAQVDLNINYYVQPERRREFIRMLEKRGAISGFESEVYRKDGGVIWISESARCVRNPRGNLVGFEGTAQDITERKHAEEALRQNEQRLRRQNEILIELSQRKTIERGDLNAALQEITESAASALEVECSSVWLFDEERTAIVCIDRYTRSASMHSKGQEFLARDFPAYFEALREELPLAADDANTDSRTQEFSKVDFVPRGITSRMESPVRLGGKMVGVIYAEHVGLLRHWTLDEKNFAGSMADLVSLAVEAAERKHAEDSLRESEAKFRAVAETAASAIYIHQGSRFLFCNRASEIISGFSREELLQLSPFDMVHPEDREYVRQCFINRRRGVSTPSRYEYRVVTKQNEIRWVDFSASMVTFEGQTAELGTAFDISERKRGEQLQSALYRIAEKTSRARDLDEIYRSIHGILSELVYARNFYIALYDPATQLLNFPYSVDEKDVLRPARKLRKGFTEYVLRTGQPILISPAEAEALVASGEVELSGTPSVDWLGIPLRSGITTYGVLALQSYSQEHRFGEREKEILTFVSQHIATAVQRKRDEEALRTSEARYRSQVQSAVYGIYRSLTMQDQFLDVNPALVAMLGYDSAQEVLALHLSTDVYADYGERANVLREYRKSERIAGVDIRWKRKDGKIITVRISGRGILNENGEVDTYEMIAEDVTERRALEEQLRQSQKMEAVGRLAGGVAHDFNNLLTVIKGYSELMLDQVKESDPLRPELEEVKKAADRAAALTRQLLAFSRKQVLAPKVLDLNFVISNLEKLLKRLLGEDVRLTVTLDASLGRVKADPGQTEQVIMNLAVNARDAMPGGGTLTITTENIFLDQKNRPDHSIPVGHYVVLHVIDSGTGMDAETKSRIFEPFFTTKEQGKGTGLGLSTVYGIVKQSGGYVWVDSQIGQGTTFKIFLPRVGDASEILPAVTAPAKKHAGDETILLVEDEDGVRALARTLLQKQGYKIIETSNGGEALLACERHPEAIHLLLTDVVLSQMSGRELAQRLASLRPEMRVLYMSGYSEEAIVQHGVLDSGTAFLQKPFNTESLVSKVREVLDAPLAKAATSHSE